MRRRRGYRYLETLRAYGLARLDEAGETAVARGGLERALLPPSDVADDWSWLANVYMSDGAGLSMLEDTTRREAAGFAHAEGRLDAAALIYCSCAFREDPGTLEAVLRQVGPLAEASDALGPVAWRAANAALVFLTRLTRRYEACFETTERMLAALDVDDPARPWFAGWRAALTTAVAPEVGLAQSEEVLEHAIRVGRPGDDGTVADVLIVMGTGLALVGRLPEARARVEEALGWCLVGSPGYDQAIGSLLWLDVIDGASPGPSVRAAVARQDLGAGLAQFCAAPAALCSDGSVAERAAELARRCRSRPIGDVATPYLLAFAWLALEQGEPDRAGALVSVAEIYDSSTHLALVHLVARIEGWTDEEWRTRRDATIARYLSADHEPEAERGPAVLDAEVERWTALD